jgi:hypothetical protein
MIALMIFLIFGFIKNGFATTVEIVQGKLLVNGEPFTIKGIGYSPVPIGVDLETTPPYGDYFTSDYSALYNRDLPLLRQMGANTIRLWGWNNAADHTDFLNKAYNNGVDPIYVIVTFWMGPSLYPDISSPSARAQIKADFRAMVAAHKDHPAILMWSIGNELNAPWMYGNKLNDLFSLINEMAEEAHQEEGSDYRPVITPLSDTNLINTIATYNPSMTSLDAWGANVYRGQSFGTLFNDYKTASNKPLVILEFGIDAYDHINGDEYENTGLPYQAIYAHDLWNEIKSNSDVCVGGTIMAYSDEWWKGKYSTAEAGCPDYNPSVHSTCGYATGSHPDGYSNEEWWGIMRTVDNGEGPDIMEQREIFSTFQYLWKGSANCPSYIFFGETVSCSIDATGEADTYTFSGSANDKVIIRMSRTSGNLSPQIELYKSDGTLFCSAWGGSNAEIKDCTLPETGTYTIRADDYWNTYTGGYNLYLGYSTPGILEVTPTDGLVSSGSQTGPFSPSSTTYTIRNTGDDSIDWTVSKTQEWVSLSSTIGTLAGGASTNVTVSINSNANSLTPDTYDDTVTFTNVTNGSGNTTRSVSLTVREPGQAIPLPLGTSERISVQKDQPIWFETVVPEGSANLFILLQKDTSWSGTLEVYKDDVILKSTSGSNDFAIQIPNPSAGSYTTKLSGSGSGVITALSSLTELILGEWAVGTILRQWGSVWYQVNVPSDQSMLSVAVETLGIWSKLEVFYGALGSTQRWSATGDKMNLQINSPPSGMYYIHLTDSAWGFGPDTSRDHLIKADVNPIEPPPATEPLITSISSTKGGNTGLVTIAINGVQLDPDATVWLSRSGENNIVAQSVSGSDDKKILTAQFDLTGASPGEWTLTVQNPDGQTVAAPVSFTIESGGEAKLWVEIVGREQIRSGRDQRYIIRCGNSGEVDAYDLVLIILVPSNSEIQSDLNGTLPEWLPSSVNNGEFKAVPIWILKLSANSQWDIPVTVSAPQDDFPANSILDIRVELRKSLESDYSRTGDMASIRTSPTFQAIVDAVADILGVAPGTSAVRLNQFSQQLLRETIEDKTEEFVRQTGQEHLRIVVQPPFIGMAIGGIIGAVAAPFLGVDPWTGAGVGAGFGGLVETGIHLFWATVDRMVESANIISASSRLLVVSSISPEDKYGPTGYDPEGTAPENLKRYIPADHSLSYKIDFWNKEDAPAPTQDVIITDQLDTDLDWNSFSFTEFGFLKWKVLLEGGQYFNVDVDLRPDNNLIVNVEGTFDPETGEIRWEFHSLDPVNYEPPEDPMAGFLPPITDTGYEIGWVIYNVNPKQGLPTGTQITNQAWVKFDVDVFKPAPPNPDSEIPGYGPYLNTIDSGKPTSNVSSLSATQTTTNFSVSWSGSDDEGGSGIKNYDIYVSDNGGAYTLWLTTSETSATFTGQNGHQYSFYSRARDNVGNIEDAPAQADASTSIYVTTYDLDGDGDGDIDIVDIMKVAAQWGWTAQI